MTQPSVQPAAMIEPRKLDPNVWLHETWQRDSASAQARCASATGIDASSIMNVSAHTSRTRLAFIEPAFLPKR